MVVSAPPHLCAGAMLRGHYSCFQAHTVLFFHLFSDILLVRLVNRLDTPTNGSLSLASNGDRNHPMVLISIEHWRPGDQHLRNER